MDLSAFETGEEIMDTAIYYSRPLKEYPTAQTISDFISCVSEIAGYNLMDYVIVDEKYKRPSEVPLLLADPSKAKRVLGWEPKTNLKQLAELMYNSDLEKEKANVR